jgi:nitrate/nitrite transporter NarK
LIVGGVRQATGAFTVGFILLSLFAVLCLMVVWKKTGRDQVASPIRSISSEEGTEL